MNTSKLSTSFRDTLSTSTTDGGRRWLYPDLVKGKWFLRRASVAYILLASLLAGPFWEWNGHPIFLFDLLNRNFIIFGVGFGPQDMNLLVLGILTFAVFIFAFTQVFGRLWCGWACPQTIFMEWVFRPLERLIEGNSAARKRLDEQESDFTKTGKKVGKLVLFWVISFAIANVFLAYIIGKKELFKILTDSPSDHWVGFLALLIFTSVFFFVFTRLREIVCTVICPYGRLQGALLDKNSLMVAYDFVRGEPRGHKKIGEENSLGDCIDCNWCVKVCPTGIDIRNGNQMECIQCTACIDACDEVMVKTQRPMDLVGFFSEAGLAVKQPFKLSNKGLAYFGFWGLLISLLGTLLFLRTPAELIVLRTPGQTGVVDASGRISNLYNFEVSNKTFVNQKLELVSLENNSKIEMVGKTDIVLSPQQVQKGSFFISLNEPVNLAKNMKLKIQVKTNGEVTDEIETQFFYIPKPDNQ
jgi:cytochrome c oxidase accessory protein FixG